MTEVKLRNLFLIFIVSQQLLASNESEIRLNGINSVVKHTAMTRAVLEIIRETTSALDIIKVTSHKNDVEIIDSFVENILWGLNGSLKLQFYNAREKAKKLCSNVLLIVSQKISNDELEALPLQNSFIADKKFLIVLLCDENSDDLFNTVKLLLGIMWRKSVMNVQVVSKNNDDVLLKTYFPFTKDFCGQVHPVIWNIFRNGTFLQRHREHFPRKDANLFRCALKVAIFSAAPYMILANNSGTIGVGGIDGTLLMTLSEKLNFSTEFLVVSEDFRWGEIFQNRSASGATELVSYFCNDVVSQR